jgi:hypothetical protein
MSRGKIVWWLFWWLFASRDLHFGRKLSDASIHAGRHCSISQLSRPTYSRLSLETRPRGLQLSRLINDLCRSSAEVCNLQKRRYQKRRQMPRFLRNAKVPTGAEEAKRRNARFPLRIRKHYSSQKLPDPKAASVFIIDCRF